MLSHGPSAVVYAICDTVVDGYVKVAAELEVDVDEVEASVFSPVRTNDSVRIYTLKREIAEVRRAVLPLREPLRRLPRAAVPASRGGSAVLPGRADHLVRAAETIDTLDSLLSTAFDAHLARVSVQQNDDMRKISAGVGLCGAHPGRRDLRHELRPHARAALDFRLPVGAGADGASSLGAWSSFKRSGWL